MTRQTILLAARHAALAGVSAFLGVYGIPRVLGVLAGTEPLDVAALRAAAAAGIAAAVAFVWRSVAEQAPSVMISFGPSRAQQATAPVVGVPAPVMVAAPPLTLTTTMPSSPVLPEAPPPAVEPPLPGA